MKTYRMVFRCPKGVHCITTVKAESRGDAKRVLIKGWDVDKIYEVWEL